MKRMIIGGCIVPTKSNIRYFEDGDAETLVGRHLADVLKKADSTVFNLDVSLTNIESPHREMRS